MTLVRRLLIGLGAVLVAFAPSARTIGADCPPDRDPPKVIFSARATGRFAPDLAQSLGFVFLLGIERGSSPARWNDYRELQTLLSLAAVQQGLGGESPGSVDVTEVAGAFGSSFLCDLKFDKAGADSRTVTCRLINTRTQHAVRSFTRALPSNETAMLDMMQPLGTQTAVNLLRDLLAEREHPVVPKVTVAVTPQEVAPGATVHVTATLTDESDCQPQPGKEIRIENKHGSTSLSSATYTTDAAGTVTQDVNVGSAPGEGTIEATFRKSDGAITRSNPTSFAYRVRDTSGDVTISAPEASVHLGAAETVTARVLHDGAPVAGATVSFAASGGGGMAATSVVTDANGDASTEYDAPQSNAVVDVVATTPPQTPGPGVPDLTASLSFVVDGGVTLNLDAADTVAGGTSDVNADLVVGGTAIPGTEVTFTLAGAGTLSAVSAPTNAAGRASVTWVAPSGDSSASITAEAVVDGQSYVSNATVHARPGAGPMRVKVVPVFGEVSNPVFRTFVELASSAPGRACSYAEADLGGVYDCGNRPYPYTYGTKADVPVTLRAELGTQFWAEVSMTQPEPKVLVVDAGVSGLGELGAFGVDACLELTFDAPGVLSVAIDTTSLTTDSTSGRGFYEGAVFRSKSGSTFTRTDDFEEGRSAGGFYGDELIGGSGTIAIAHGGKLQLIVYAQGGGYATQQALVPNGRIRFTFTFRPQ